ncbi:hypothetical protein AUC68_10740 [Methyloceanibacter methanicus]|uniref:Uncharacterized protein n=1 Tax=Methyloceanibacter methanicus TaxID=1774968 RepID=A0A1E3VXI5_9HYPH|nr:hypothetical protein AUC68_10740 [Methyloceanibacter methanicus]
MGAYEKALADFDTALATNGLFQPQNAHIHKSVVYEKLKDLDKALGELDKAVKVMPGDGTTYFNRGRVLALRGRTDDALADYTKAIKLDPDFAAPTAIAATSTRTTKTMTRRSRTSMPPYV